jgi:hypothetical protein
VSFGNGSACEACTYTYSGSTLTITISQDGGAGGESITDDVTISGNTLTYNPADGGTSYEYTRVNSSGSNSCQ